MVNQDLLHTENELWLSESDCVARLKARPVLPGPVFVYSSLLKGWTDSVLGGLVGIDDHGFHRGDGVFEAVKVVNRRAWLLEPHWRRMETSAQKISLKVPFDFQTLQRILRPGLEKFPEGQALLRMFLTRGPGGFSTHPGECLEPGFFAVLCPFKAVAEEKYKSGVRVGKSALPMKSPWLAVTKTLNYLPNVMMKKESLDRGLDFVVGFDESGGLGESSTENMIVLTKEGTLAHPPLKQILKGCTMLRLFDLVEQKRLLPVQRERVLTEKDLLEAQALFMVGTTLDVLWVGEFEGKAYQTSVWSERLRSLLREDQLTETKL